MEAAVSRAYGPPEVVRIEEVEKPAPADNEILVKIQFTPVNMVDAIFRSGGQVMARMFTGPFKSRFPILGSELSGEVEEAGSAITRFSKGDKVIACSDEAFETHAEYILLKEDRPVMLLPEGVSGKDAVAAMQGVLTATPFLREGAELQEGQSILINGAAGSIGVIAVQLAKHMGAHVTAVCSGANVDLVARLGADEVIDYTKADFTENRDRYDVVFDIVAKSSYYRCRRALAPGGIYLTTGADLLLLPAWAFTSIVGGKRGKAVFAGMRTTEQKLNDMAFCYSLMEKGKLRAVIDKVLPLERILEAHRLVDTGHKKGAVLISMEDGG